MSQQIKTKALFLVQEFKPMLFACCVFLTSCGLLPEGPNPEVEIESVSIALDSDANSNMATSVDLILVYDPDLAKVMGKVDSKTYYATVNQIKQDNPELIDIYHWELAPGQSIANYPIEPQDGPDIWAAYFFADYKSKGDHRVRLGSSEKATVHLKALDFCVLEVGCFPPAGSADVTAGENAYQKLLTSRTKVQQIEKLDPRLQVSNTNVGRKVLNQQNQVSAATTQARGEFARAQSAQQIITD